MVGWHHRLDGHELEQALGIGDGQGSLACCHPWGRKGSDTTKQMFMTAIFTIAKMWKQPKRPSKDKWITELLFLHTEEHYLILRKK